MQNSGMVLGQIKKRFGISRPEVKALSEEELQGGFEEIYAVETVDLKTVKPIDSRPEPEARPEEIRVVDGGSAQMDLGIIGTIESFVLDEPVSVLGLSPQLESLLKAAGKRELRHLFQEQGEAKQKLEAYIAGKELFKCRKIDFAAWVKSLIPEQERKKCWLVLEEYGLEKMLSLAAMETVEIKRLSEERKKQWREEGRTLFSSQRFLTRWKQVGASLLKPWILERTGIAKEYELEERMERLAVNAAIRENAVRFFCEVLLQGMDFYGACFPQVEQGVYVANKNTAACYHKLIETAKSYFYHSGISYPFDHLISLVSRELAKSWDGFPEEFVEKALYSSPSFVVFKKKSSLTVQLQIPAF